MRRHTISGLLLLIILAVALSGCSTTAGARRAADEPLAEITDIRLQDDTLSIAGSRDFAYTIYAPNDPYKISIDIPDMTVGRFTDKIVFDRGGIADVTLRQIDSPTRSVKIDIALQTPASVDPTYRDNTLNLLVKPEKPVVMEEVQKEDEASSSSPEEASGGQEAVVTAPAPAEAPMAGPEAADAAPLAKADTIEGVEVMKSGKDVKVLVTGNGSMVPNVFPIPGRVVVDVPGVAMNAAVPLEVIPPLRGIRVGKHKDKVRLVLDLKEKTNFDVSATRNTIEIVLKGKETTPQAAVAEPMPAQAPAEAVSPGQEDMAAGQAEGNGATVATVVAQPEKVEEGKYSGKRISLDFQNADIIPIFRLLADISGYNIVVHPSVKGRITLKLINVPWDQAMDIILRTFSLTKEVDGNIMRIVPTSIVAKESDEMAKVKKALAEAGDLKTRVFPVNYAVLANIKDAIDKAKILSSRGNISLDERASSLIVNDIEPNLEKIGALIKELDQERMQARQVMIEAKIVEINTDYTKDLGIQWGLNYMTAGKTNPTTIGGVSGIGGTGFSGNNFLVNLPAAVGAGSGGAIGFGYINRSLNLALDVQLSALESNSKGRIISNPKIITMNNQAARIKQGKTIYVTSATSDKVGTTAINADLELKVTPRITPDGAIFMDIKITKNEQAPSSVGNSVDVLTNEIETVSLVNNEDTIVIGGVFKTTTSKTDTGVPALSKLPLLGSLFKRKQDVETKSEILIFLTPKIVEFQTLK